MPTPLGYQQITDLSSAVGLTIPSGACYCLIIAEVQNVRWRDDGVNPTGTVGMPLLAGNPLRYDGVLSSIKFIQVASGATLSISYY